MSALSVNIDPAYACCLSQIIADLDLFADSHHEVASVLSGERPTVVPPLTNSRSGALNHLPPPSRTSQLIPQRLALPPQATD